MKNRLIFGSMLILMAGIFSCQKSGNNNGESSTGTNLYTATAEIMGTQIGKNLTSDEQSIAVEKFDGSSPAFLAGDNGSHINFGMHGWEMHGIGPLRFGVPHIDSCVTVTVSSITYPREIVIEYLEGCSMHKHDKHGKIIINLSDTITHEGALQTITYQDFYIDSIKVDLTASLENRGKNESGNWIIEKKYTQKLTRNEQTFVRTNNELIEWVSGFETTDKADNVYYISGSGSVVLNDTATYSKTITTPLLFDASCEFIKSGVVELNRRGNVSVIDYGAGTCDDIATITTNGTTEEINLHSNRFKEGGEFGKHCHGFGHGPHH
jgi:hypothetical protein